jgi:hypothetical protein
MGVLANAYWQKAWRPRRELEVEVFATGATPGAKSGAGSRVLPRKR